MKILLDHSAPKGLARHLPDHQVIHTSELGWAEASNGSLLGLAEANGYRLLITADKNIPWQQSLSGRALGILMLSTNNWPLLQQYIPAIAEAVEGCEPGTVRHVFCGRFVPRHFKNPGPTL